MAHFPEQYYKQPTMNATTIDTTTIVEPTKTLIKVKKQRGPYKPRKPKALVFVEEDSESEPEEEPEPVASPIPEPTDFTLTEEDLVEGARLVAEQEAKDEDEDEDDEDLKSSISSIQEESEDEEEEEEVVTEEDPEDEEEADKDEPEEATEEPELMMPVLEKDPILLREQILNLQAEVIRLTKFNQDLQRRLEGERKQPKKKAEKAKKEKKEGKRENKRAKRPSDYAEKYLKKGQVLRWEHKARKAWGEATYIGNNAFTAKFSFKPEGEYPEEFPSLNAVAGVMLKHLTLRSLNAWSAFKNLDGTSVENLDLQAKA